MKFLVCFSLLICAVFAQGFEFHSRPRALNIQPQNEELDKLHKFVEGNRKDLQKAVDKTLVATENFLVEINLSTENIVKETKDETVFNLDMIIKSLQEIAEELESARECLEALYAPLNALIQEAKNIFDTCSTNAHEQSKIVFENVQAKMNVAKNKIGGFKGLINDCVESSANPTEVSPCVINKVTQIREITLDLIKNAENALKAGVPTNYMDSSNQIIKQTNICVETASETVAQKYLPYVKKVSSCMENAEVY